MEEFNKYKQEIEGEAVVNAMTGDSKDEISKIASRLAIIVARLGQELAYIKNEYHARFKKLCDEGMSANRAAIEAEAVMTAEFKEQLKASRREVEYLRDDLNGMAISGQSRVASLRSEGILP